jgi:hypothetical protein
MAAMAPSQLARLCRSSRLAGIALVVGSLLAFTGVARAQVTPAAGYTPPDDTPSIKVGTMIFASYVFQEDPLVADADGNLIHPTSFDITRAYINVTGQINHRIAFRVTPDITRMTTTTKTTGLMPGETVTTTTSLDGSLSFRLKYTYGQFNLDEAWSKGSWARFGLQQTPYIDWLEGIYRYRFQGTILVDRDGFMSSSDFGVSAHYNMPGNFGDIHFGYYNGDTYSKPDANDQKSFQARVSFRPAPMVGVLKGLRVTAFYNDDSYVQSDPKHRFVATLTFEHKYVNAGVETVSARDQATGASPEVTASGYSVWATPRFGKGWEGLLRYDRVRPNNDTSDIRERKIAGGAYWFKTQLPMTTAMLLDFERDTYSVGLAKPDEERYGLHMLFNY